MICALFKDPAISEVVKSIVLGNQKVTTQGYGFSRVSLVISIFYLWGFLFQPC